MFPVNKKVKIFDLLLYFLKGPRSSFQECNVIIFFFILTFFYFFEIISLNEFDWTKILSTFL